MEIEHTIREDGGQTRAMLRIAVPVWGRPKSDIEPVNVEEPTREDFEHFLKSTLKAEELRKTCLKPDERRQLAITRRIRDALYGQPDFV